MAMRSLTGRRRLLEPLERVLAYELVEDRAPHVEVVRRLNRLACVQQHADLPTVGMAFEK